MREPMEYKLTRKGRRTVYDGKILTLCEDLMELPDGREERWDFIHHKHGGGACTVPVLADGRILLVRQYRPMVDRETLELPAGAREDPREDGSVTAERELREETGRSAGRLTFLTRIDSMPAWCDESTEIYLAEDLSEPEGQLLDEAEEIRLEAFTLEDLLVRIFRGEIRDGKTVAGILAYAVMRHR